MGMGIYINKKNKNGENDIAYFGKDFAMKEYFLRDIKLRPVKGEEGEYYLTTRQLRDFLNYCLDGLIEDKHKDYFEICNDEITKEDRQNYWARVIKDITEGLKDYNKKEDMLIFVDSE